MALSAAPTTKPPSIPSDGRLSRFHLVAVVFQRVKQLRSGARPRVDAGDHKATRVALLEVLADTVSWSTA